MTAYTAEMSADLPCHRCGYDLRAHALDGKCPECEASVAESRRLAAIPLRPAWRDSDPRWRRRMLAGAWVLVLLPLMDVLQKLGWASRMRVPALFVFRKAIRTLNDTFLYDRQVYPRLTFCIGVVLLFSKERGRRRSRLDWTRRWGILCSYVTLLLSAAPTLFIAALVAVGIGALFQSMPLKYQPAMTPLLVKVSSTYLRYGPQPTDSSVIVLVAFSSIAILLACVPLYDALRSSGPRPLARALIAPLGLFSLMHLAQAGLYCIDSSGMTSAEVFHYGWYFRPDLLVAPLSAGLWGSPLFGYWVVEVIKWCIVLAIAVWLSIARFAAWWRTGSNATRQKDRP
jgi:hypothetical protein